MTTKKETKRRTRIRKTKTKKEKERYKKSKWMIKEEQRKQKQQQERRRRHCSSSSSFLSSYCRCEAEEGALAALQHSGARTVQLLVANWRPLSTSAESSFVVDVVWFFVVRQSSALGSGSTSSWDDGFEGGKVRVRRVWPTLCHVLQSFPPQADSSQRRRWARPTLSLLPQGLRLDARPVYASSDARSQVPLLIVRQSVLSAVAASRSREIAYGREVQWNPIQI